MKHKNKPTHSTRCGLPLLAVMLLAACAGGSGRTASPVIETAEREHFHAYLRYHALLPGVAADTSGSNAADFAEVFQCGFGATSKGP